MNPKKNKKTLECEFAWAEFHSTNNKFFGELQTGTDRRVIPNTAYDQSQKRIKQIFNNSNG